MKSLLAMLLLAGTCTGLFGQLLYIGNAAEDTISAYVIDQQSGLLTELLPRVVSPGSPTSVTIHPSGKFVYVTNAGNPALGVNAPSIAVFSIDATRGALALQGTVPLTPGTGPQGAVVDSSGKFLLVANSGPGNVSVYSIDASTGALTAIPGSPFPVPQGPTCVLVHPTGKFAYVSAGTAGQVAAFSIATTGALTAIDGSPFAARTGLVWMAMDPAGKFLYAVERQDNAVLVYSIDATTGALTQVGTPVQAGAGVLGVSVDPTGKYLYVADAGIGSVTKFNIGANGGLSGRIDYGGIPVPFSTILDPSGKFLYVPAQVANSVVGFSIDSNSGALTQFPGRVFPSGISPQRGATVLLNPPVMPPVSVDSVFNYYSHAVPGMPNSGIARGSQLAINGKNIGPATSVASDAALSTELGGVSVQIQSGDVITAGLMVFASNTLVTVVVPSSTPLGDATVTVTYNGRTTDPFPITIVSTSVGIRTRNDEGSGPARAANATPDTSLDSDISTLPANTLSQSAKPGQFMLISAMGLGAATFDESKGELQVLDLPADVIVGNNSATVKLKVRVLTGVDFILFQLPDDVPLGCYVPLAIRAGGITSNVVSISVSASGGSCSDVTGLSASDIDAAQRAGKWNSGVILLSHLDFALFGAQDNATGTFTNYNIDSFLSALAPGMNQGTQTSTTSPPVGTCAVSPGTPTTSELFELKPDPAPFQFLNVGQALNLSGPQGTVQLPGIDYVSPRGRITLTPGDYTVDNGTGNGAFGPFKASLNLPPAIKWTNKDDLNSPDRSKDLTVIWTGGLPDKEVAVIFGLAVSKQVTAAFLCMERVQAGKFTVPSWVLSSLPASDPITQDGETINGGILAVGNVPLTNAVRFTAPGFDFATFTYEQATINLVSYQ